MSTLPRSRAWGLPGVLLVFAALPVAAQSGAPPRADPLDPAAPVPAVRHTSPLAGLRSSGPTPPGSWRAANDNVARIGGWRAYAREAAAEAQPPTASAAKGVR